MMKAMTVTRQPYPREPWSWPESRHGRSKACVGESVTVRVGSGRIGAIDARFLEVILAVVVGVGVVRIGAVGRFFVVQESVAVSVTGGTPTRLRTAAVVVGGIQRILAIRPLIAVTHTAAIGVEHIGVGASHRVF